MGYWFTIGRATVSAWETETDDPTRNEIQSTVLPAEQALDERDPADVHDDEYDRGPGASRSVSYGPWNDTVERFPNFQAAWDAMHEYATADNYEFIPVSVYEVYLNDIEREAQQRHRNLTGGGQATDRHLAEVERALWFVRWSRVARKHFGKLAAFETPGEWV